MTIEDSVKEYIRIKCAHSLDGIRIPMSKIAEDLDFSTVTVWRTVQRLKDRNVIKIIKSMNKTEPDIIYYIGEINELHTILDDLITKGEGMLLVMQELRRKLKEQDDIIFNLMKDR